LNDDWAESENEMTILTDDDVNEMIRILDSSAYDKLHIRTSEFELTLKRSVGGWTQERTTLREAKVAGAARAETPTRSDAAAASSTDADVAGLFSVRAPIVGTFYRAPKPGAAPFVEVGSMVDEQSVIGIIETMKLMNSIPAGARGEIVEILASNGTLVEAGQTLMRLKP
jgi:acetyl-CoA carboxylase biotin carboxyl carrier protein